MTMDDTVLLKLEDVELEDLYGWARAQARSAAQKGYWGLSHDYRALASRAASVLIDRAVEQIEKDTEDAQLRLL